MQPIVRPKLTSSSFHKFGTANDSKRSAPQSSFTTTGLGPVKWRYILSLMHQSIPAAPIPPPPSPRDNCRAFARIVSPGGRVVLANPRATPGLLTPRGFWLEIQTWTTLSGKISSLLPIGLSAKDWTKLCRILKVCFLDFMHFLIVYQATTWEITVYTLKRDLKIQRDYVFCIQNVCDNIPGVGHLSSSFIPTPGNLPPKTKKEKVLMPRG